MEVPMHQEHVQFCSTRHTGPVISLLICWSLLEDGEYWPIKPLATVTAWVALDRPWSDSRAK